MTAVLVVAAGAVAAFGLVLWVSGRRPADLLRGVVLGLVDLGRGGLWLLRKILGSPWVSPPSDAWMSIADQRRLLSPRHQGLFFHRFRLSDSDSYKNVLISGGVGSGKSLRWAVPNILGLGDCSLVINDPSGELYAMTSQAKADQSFRVLALGAGVPGSISFNPLAGLSPRTVDAIAQAVSRWFSTSPPRVRMSFGLDVRTLTVWIGLKGWCLNFGGRRVPEKAASRASICAAHPSLPRSNVLFMFLCMDNVKRLLIRAIEGGAELQHLRPYEIVIEARCSACGHSSTASIPSLIARLGGEFPVHAIGAVMRCRACSARDVSTRPVLVSDEDDDEVLVGHSMPG